MPSTPTLPKKTDPQLSALLNWRDDSKTFGVLAQVFSQKRHLRRDGIETLGYSKIAPGSAIALSNPDLAGVAYPNAIGSALFEQERERTGGLVTLQFKPTTDLSFDLTGFKSEMEASNYNRELPGVDQPHLDGGAGQAPRRRLCGAQRHLGAGQLHARARPSVRDRRRDPSSRLALGDRLLEPARRVEERRSDDQRQARSSTARATRPPKPCSKATSSAPGPATA